jgi:hypothetical protein
LPKYLYETCKYILLTKSVDIYIDIILKIFLSTKKIKTIIIKKVSKSIWKKVKN